MVRRKSELSCDHKEAIVHSFLYEQGKGVLREWLLPFIKSDKMSAQGVIRTHLQVRIDTEILPLEREAGCLHKTLLEGSPSDISLLDVTGAAGLHSPSSGAEGGPQCQDDRRRHRGGRGRSGHHGFQGQGNMIPTTHSE